MKSKLIYISVFMIVLFGGPGVSGQNVFPDLRTTGADWGIWIDNGLVNPDENVRMTVTVPAQTLAARLPSSIQMHVRYLEDSSNKIENIALKWSRSATHNEWQAIVRYRPKYAGNYYASINFYGREIFSYFAVWQPGLTAVNFWMQMPAEYHDYNNLKDIYLPSVRAGHLPIDYELVLVGERVFGENWEPRNLFREAQVETGAEVIPFFDGGYFHKLDTDFNSRFNSITSKIQGYENLVSEETTAVHGYHKLPDPTFHSLTSVQCTAIIEGAQRYWKLWGFRPFTGIGTYSPSNTLVQSCRDLGIKWISGVFADYDFTDGLDRWEVGWRQKHRGMPSFPYLISTTDFRWTGTADMQSTMMFPGWQNLPVWDHEDRHQYGTDLGSYNGYAGLSAVDRMMLFSKVFERDNRLADNKFPLAETFCIQMNSPQNVPTMAGLVDRARQGRLIFIHKRYLQTYFREHHIQKNPDICYTIPDAELGAGRTLAYHFSDETVWEGSDGKAAFISEPTAPLEKGRSIYLPVWWYDYITAKPLSPKINLAAVDLSYVSIKPANNINGKSLIIQSSKEYNGLPICLWGLNIKAKPSARWITKYRAMKVAAPESEGDNAVTWIIRPKIKVGKTIIPVF